MDIRFPIGLLFSSIGTLLTAFGLMSDARIYQRSLGINVNLWWGLVMLAFGALVLYRSHRSVVTNLPARTTPRHERSAKSL